MHDPAHNLEDRLTDEQVMSERNYGFTRGIIAGSIIGLAAPLIMLGAVMAARYTGYVFSEPPSVSTGYNTPMLATLEGNVLAINPLWTRNEIGQNTEQGISYLIGPGTVSYVQGRQTDRSGSVNVNYMFSDWSKKGEIDALMKTGIGSKVKITVIFDEIYGRPMTLPVLVEPAGSVKQ